MYDREELEELIERIDILDYISQFADFEEKNGEYWALSPLKAENTPSFSVRREDGSFYDFSSGVGGNVYTFVRHFFGCGADEAVQKLREYAGGSHERPERVSFSAEEVARRFAPPKKRGKQSKSVLLDENYMQRYEKREDKLALWEREGISRASLDRFQVFYDSFSDRLVYPIRSPTGEIVNIGGRTLDPAWKERKLRKYTYFFSWGEMNAIYGLAENREAIEKSGEIIIFEGAKSVLLADTWGIGNTAALLTSHLSRNQLKILVGLGCRVVFALDKDVRIRDDRNIKALRQYAVVEYLCDRENLLEAKDAPVDKGRDVFKTLYERRLVWR